MSKLRCHSNISKSNWEKPPKISMSEQWIMNCNGFVRQRSCPNWGIIPIYLRVTEKNLPKPQCVNNEYLIMNYNGFVKKLSCQNWGVIPIFLELTEKTSQKRSVWTMNNKLERICKEMFVSKLRYHYNISTSNWEKPPKTSACLPGLLGEIRRILLGIPKLYCLR